MKATLMIIAFLATAAANAQKFSDLNLSARPEKTVLAPLEPLTITIELTNASSGPITAHRDLTPGYGYIGVALGPKDGKIEPYRGPGWGKYPVKPGPSTIQPKESIRDEVVITGLAKPGRYLIKINWSDLGFTEQIESTLVEIEVKSAVGQDSAGLSALEKDDSLVSILTRGDLGTIEDADKIHAFMSAHGASSYAPHMALSLGRHYVEAKAPLKARTVLEIALKSAPMSRVRREAVLLMVRALMQENKEADARKLLQETVAEVQNTPQAPLHGKMLKEIG